MNIRIEIHARRLVTMQTNSTLIKRINKHKAFFLIGLPGMLLILLFNYLPMKGILIAFQDYSPYKGILKSQWVGFDHFIRLFSDPRFYSMLRNTLVISILSLSIFPLPIILSLMLNEIRNASFNKGIQTAIYLPHFLSWTVVVSLTYLLLSGEQGLINKIAVELGGTAHDYLFDEKWFYPLLIIQKTWKGIGWNTIVYLAAIVGVDTSLYEAAKIDGANKLQQIWYVTIPAIMPTVIVMFVLQMGTVLSVDFEHIYLMTNPMVKSLSEVFEVYIYQFGIKSGTQYGYTTAIGMFKSVINTILVLFTNWLVHKRGYEKVI